MRAHRRGTLLAALGVGASLGAYEILRLVPPPVTGVYSAPITREDICRRLSQSDLRDPCQREFCGLPPMDAGARDERDAHDRTQQSEIRSGVHRKSKKRGWDRKE